MAAPEIKEFKAAAPGWDGPVGKLNELVRAVNRLNKMEGDRQFVIVTFNDAGINIGLDLNAILQRIPHYKDPRILCIVTAHTLTSANRWSYTVAQSWEKPQGSIVQNSGAWTMSGVLNLNEANNVESGLLGNGVSTTNIPNTGGNANEFALQPIPIGTPVLVEPIAIYGTNGRSDWWITSSGYNNAVDGRCSGTPPYHH